jgi:hypothetical protein
VPVLVRGGSLLPLQGEDGLELHAFGAAPWHGLLYTDAGDGFGPACLDRFHLASRTAPLERRSGGDYPAPAVRVVFR